MTETRGPSRPVVCSKRCRASVVCPKMPRRPQDSRTSLSLERRTDSAYAAGRSSADLNSFQERSREPVDHSIPDTSAPTESTAKQSARGRSTEMCSSTLWWTRGHSLGTCESTHKETHVTHVRTRTCTRCACKAVLRRVH